MADEKNVRPVSCVPVSRYSGWNEIINQTIKRGNCSCKFGFHESRAAFRK
jgi:hypothetical protein